MEKKVVRDPEIKNVYQILTLVQNELKAPKKQVNKFGGYNYRSCEDIQEAVKPILLRYNSTLILDDDIVTVGNRIYVKAIALFTYTDPEGKKDSIQTTGFAREEENKKGMDSMQLTGATSSYARKYALNAMFLIDDSKDSDFTNEHKKDVPKITEVKEKVLMKLTDTQIDEAIEFNKEDAVLKNVGIRYSLDQSQLTKLKNSIEQKQNTEN